MTSQTMELLEAERDLKESRLQHIRCTPNSLERRVSNLESKVDTLLILNTLMLVVSTALTILVLSIIK